MPLITGKSQKSFVKNLKTEMHEGKPMKQSLAIAYAMKKKAQKKAEGGEVDGPALDPAKAKKFVQGFTGQPEPKDDSGEEGIVDRIMKRFSKGGQVANETDQECADKMPDQFDDLVLDDDLEFSDTGANSGDELGDAQEDHDRKDIVARIMSSRKKKDKLPSPA